MVRQPPVPAGDRAAGAGRPHEEVPGHAHVRHLRPPEERHEGRGAADGAGHPSQEGGERLDHR